MSGKYSKNRKPRRSKSFSISITETKKRKTLYSSKYISSDPQLQRMLNAYQPFARLNGEKNRKDGSGGKSSGPTLPEKGSGSKAKRQRSGAYAGQRSERLRQFPLSGKIQYRSLGVLSEKQSLRKVFLDYDFSRSPRLRPTWVNLRLWNLQPAAILDARTRKGWHRTIVLTRRLSPWAIVAIQACEGSDRRREALNIMRLLSLGSHYHTSFAKSRWNLLFERKIWNYNCKEIT